MVLSDFLIVIHMKLYQFNSTWKVLQSKYYNIGEDRVGKYLVQTRSEAKSNGISLPEVNGKSKGLDLNILPKKQVIKPIVTSVAKGRSQIKPEIGQGRASLRQKIKSPIPLLIYIPL